MRSRGSSSHASDGDRREPVSIAALTSYVSATIPSRYTVEVIWDGREWVPAEHIAMPSHHSSRLFFTNLEDPACAALRAEGKGRLRLTIELESSRIEQVPNEMRWWAEYGARVIEVRPA
jgi:hypothetical protein